MSTNNSKLRGTPKGPVMEIEKATTNDRDTAMPHYARQMLSQYHSQIAHVFAIHGNINDYSDNSESVTNITQALTLATDSFIRAKKGIKKKVNSYVIDITGEYNTSSGLKFSCEESKKEFEKLITENVDKKVLAEQWPMDWNSWGSPNIMFFVMNEIIAIQRKLLEAGLQARADGRNPNPEVRFTLIINDADVLFPDGPIVSIAGDRPSVVHMRTWARDPKTALRLRVVLLTRYLKDIHESIRGLPKVSGISIPKPNYEDRLEWLTNFNAAIIREVTQAEADGEPAKFGQVLVPKGLQFTEDFSLEQFAVQSAGMSRIQLWNTIMHQMRNSAPITFDTVREMKQKAIQEEYQGIVDFEEPQHGFDEIGGHEAIKDYFRRKIIVPLQNGDTRRVSSGILLTGPPGTGKSKIAMALAKESKMNFMVGHLSRLFGGLVGETEQKTRKFFEAVESAAPVILFLDEIDSVLSSGRTSSGDSGTSARMFNTLMQFLSDDSRKGKIVVVAASNRPDLLDAAFIRAGRFDAKLPVLPPSKTDSTGRMKILIALTKKHKITFTPDFDATKTNPNSGFGLLLQDRAKIWTGAEIEVVVKEAFDNAYFANRKLASGKQDLRITIEDWNKAMSDIIPNTGAVEEMTNLSLYYVDHLGYLTGEWRSLAANKESLKETLTAAGYNLGSSS